MTPAARAIEEIVLASAAIELTFLPTIGARLHRLSVFGHDLLRTPADTTEHERDPFFWGAYHMAPWCNRIEAGPRAVGSQTIDLPANFADGSAIHGQVYVRRWQVIGDGQFSIHGGGDGWPWPYEVNVEAAVDELAVRIEQRLTNLADESMPAGIGLHPWLRLPAQLAVPAGLVYPTNSDSPTAPLPVGGPFDLRRLGQLSVGLDATWTGLDRPAIELAWPKLDLAATLTSSWPTLHVTAASPSHLDAIALEPQTHAPQGLRRLLRGEPGALTWLEPGGVLRQTLDFSFRSTEPTPRRMTG